MAMNLFLEKTAINLVSGAMGSLLPKLVELVKEEYRLNRVVKEQVESLKKEMKIMHAALRKVAEVPRDELDDQVMLWAGEVRELSFDMEDIVDKFLVRIDDGPELAANSSKLKRLTEKMAGLFIKGKARHQIADAIKDMDKKVQEVTSRHGRYTVDTIIARPAAMTTIDPRLRALYTEVTELVGIDGKRDQEIMRLLLEGDNETSKKLKIVSVVGFGGLGKTTLVKTVYDKIKRDFDCSAFVPVGRNADAKKILMDILLDIGMFDSMFTMLDERQLINKLREGLENKRYLIVIDDIWDETLWMVINCAFSKSNTFGSRIITTTRIVSVSNKCCSSPNDSIYQMKPLSDNDSKRLFYKRIFSDESRCQPEFEGISIDILRKCGGVPLAIITIASMLTSDQWVRPKEEWQVLLESIGRGLTEDRNVDDMKRILSFSYYDLPSHLKTCLLYLSMFPEDYEIRKDRLIWMWIAESFVQCGKTKTSLFEIGETYYNELVNRSMVQLVYNNDEGREVEACRVHDMVLDLICSLSSEANFVTVLNGTGDGMPSQSNTRRLSLQNPIEGLLRYEDMLKVRSVALFQPAICLIPSFLRFSVLRVLDLTRCDLSDHNHFNLRELCNLFHLRYLGLSETKVSEVPEEIGKLQFLHVLDLSGNKDVRLPLTVIKLRRLMCLLIDSDHKVLPNELGNLTSVEVLSVIRCDSRVVNELGNMLRLRKLGIQFDNLTPELEESFVQSLAKLSNIQSVQFSANNMPHMDHLGECWVPPQSLQEFLTGVYIRFSKLPVWIRMNPSRLCKLSKLEITVDELQLAYLEILGRLPALHSLILWGSSQSGMLLVGAGGFRCLTSFQLTSPGQIVFQQGAMPKAAHVELEISLGLTEGEVSSSGGNYFDLGMENLPSLRNVRVTFYRSSVTIEDAKQAEDALENTLSAHPNSPTFHISFMPPGSRKTSYLVSPVPLFS